MDEDQLVGDQDESTFDPAAFTSTIEDLGRVEKRMRQLAQDAGKQISNLDEGWAGVAREAFGTAVGSFSRLMTGYLDLSLARDVKTLQEALAKHQQADKSAEQVAAQIVTPSWNGDF